MASNDSRRRAARTGVGRRNNATAKDRAFPPLSVTTDNLLRDGSDREFRRLIYSLVGFAEMVVRHRNAYGAYLGVTGPQYVMMTIIAESPNTTIRDVAKATSVSDQFVTSEIGKLVRDDIVEKTPDAADRRSVLLNLTLKGRKLLTELAPLRRESNDLMYRSLTPERMKVLQDILDKLIADAEIALHELDAPQRRGQKAPTASSATGVRERRMKRSRK
jgi:DNA-binding MarR family transcriptional regulator